ncbi:MAG: EamA family transporter [Candidatus Nanoarchaeia archaeon]
MNKLIIILLMILDGLIGALGAIQLKLASKKVQLSIKLFYKNFYNKNIIFGIFLYALALGLVIFLFSKEHLSLIYPLTSLAYIFTVILSSIILKEKITKYKWLALALIVAGNILITYQI